VELILFLV
jgi:hypothetical protein